VGYPQAQVAMTDVHGIKVTGGSFPAQIWSRYMKAATGRGSASVGAPGAEEEEAQPVMALVCTESMQLANARCPQPMEMALPPGTAPRKACTLH